MAALMWSLCRRGSASLLVEAPHTDGAPLCRWHPGLSSEFQITAYPAGVPLEADTSVSEQEDYCLRGGVTLDSL